MAARADGAMQGQESQGAQGRAGHGDPFFPSLHRVHPSGWLNDPNGIIRWRGRWHVFFQYNPDSARHHLIRWGHVSSPDLVSWRAEADGPVPRPGELDSDGCWSGVAVADGDRVGLVYSGVSGESNALSRVIVQRGDAELESWTPVPGTVADVPDEPGIVGLRDPFLFELDGRRLAIQGAGLRRTGADGRERTIPALLAWDRDDLDDWRYLGIVLTGDDPVAARHAPAELWECPQLVPLVDEATGERRWVATLGRWTETDSGESSLNGVSYLTGRLAWDADRGCPTFTPETGGDVDAGPDFYAPQAYVDGDRVLLWGWSWEGAERTQDQTDAQGWAGCLTFPRELALGEGRLVSRVPSELRALRRRSLEVARGTGADGGGGAADPGRPAKLGHASGAAQVHGGSFDSITLPSPARAEVRSERGVRIDLVAADGSVRRRAAEHLDGPVTVFVDASVVEVLPDAGVPQTVRIYPEGGESVRVTAAGAESVLEAWELGLPDPT